MTAHSCNRTRGCKPETEAKYRPALELYAATDLSYVEICRQCDNMDYIEYNVSQIARESGLTGTNLGRQLHTHYPEVLEFREWAR